MVATVGGLQPTLLTCEIVCIVCKIFGISISFCEPFKLPNNLFWDISVLSGISLHGMEFQYLIVQHEPFCLLAGFLLSGSNNFSPHSLQEVPTSIRSVFSCLPGIVGQVEKIKIQFGQEMVQCSALVVGEDVRSLWFMHAFKQWHRYR